ncbi:DUF1800 domain-containing protein [Mycolicibacterium madagascariense]|nr:DUF1800 domain-containing protein [Mycolicibacterium madagascariense]
MLRRAGFGTTGAQVDAVVAQGAPAYLDGALDLDPDADPGAIATPMPAPVMPQQVRPGATATEMNDYAQQLFSQMNDLQSWWLRRMAAVHQPIHEKLTLLWHNHFATSADKVGGAQYMAAQNQKLRTLKLGDFRTLAYAMLTDVAMQLWLDGVRNTKAAPNENLSREFMELFTLGHANGYTEVDVKEGARALTGRVVGYTGQTAISDELHDSSTKTVLGVKGDLDEHDFCDIVLNQPTSAPFVASSLWRLLASDDAPSPAALTRLVGAYGPGRDLKALTRAVLLDPEFATCAGTLVNTPVEWLMGAIRSLSIPVDGAQSASDLKLAQVLVVMGQRPFYPPDVGGWPRGSLWLSTTSVAARVWAADKLVTTGDLSSIDEAAKGDRINATGYLIGIGKWSDRTVAALDPLADDPRRLVAAALNSPEYLVS